MTFRISERANRVVLWMNVCFNIEYQCQNDTISVGFVSLRGDNKSIIIKMTQEQGGLVTVCIALFSSLLWHIVSCCLLNLYQRYVRRVASCTCVVSP